MGFAPSASASSSSSRNAGGAFAAYVTAQLASPPTAYNKKVDDAADLEGGRLPPRQQDAAANQRLPLLRRRVVAVAVSALCFALVHVLVTALESSSDYVLGSASPLAYDERARARAQRRGGGGTLRPSEAERRDKVERADAALDALSQDASVVDGVLCRTLQSHDGALLFAEMAERDIEETWCDDDVASCYTEYVRRARKACTASGLGRGGVKDVAKPYVGTWEAEGDPTDGDLRLLKALATWLDPPPYSPPPPPSAEWARELLMLTHPDGCDGGGSAEGGEGGKWADCFVLDFGCGSGEELLEMHMALGTPPSRLLGLDIFASEAHRGEYTRHVLADPKDVDAYCASLDALAEQLLERTVHSGGVALATSSVTFHHLPSEQMRGCVYGFLARLLGERGTFVLREWDNSPSRHAPPSSSLEVWFDVAHSFTPALPASTLPASASELRIAPGTNYSSWATYYAQAFAAGLILNTTLQWRLTGAMPTTLAHGNTTFEAWPLRNFEAVLSKRPLARREERPGVG